MTTIKSTICEAIKAGKNNAEVLEAVKAAHPDSNTTAACVSYYRSKMKKEGATSATSKPAPKPSAATMTVAEAKDKLKAAVAAQQGPKGTSVYSIGKVKEFEGLEGLGYNATLLRDGKHVADLIDDASGGPMWIEWRDQKAGLVKVMARDYKGDPMERNMTHEEKAFHEVAIALPDHVCGFVGSDGEVHKLKMDMELYADELVNQFLQEKELIKLVKGKVAFISNDKLYTMKGDYDESAKAYLAKKHPKAVVLNVLPKAEAIALLKKVNG